MQLLLQALVLLLHVAQCLSRHLCLLLCLA
jgi:hypothetical protein